MSRLFLELHPEDLRGLLGTMTEAWLKAMVQAAGPEGRAAGPEGRTAASGRLRQAQAAREPQRLALVDQASRLSVCPGHKADVVPLLQAALPLLEPQRILEDREWARKLTALLNELAAGAEVPRDDPASGLPPPGALPPEAWNDLGLRLLATGPAPSGPSAARRRPWRTWPATGPWNWAPGTWTPSAARASPTSAGPRP